MQAAKEISLKSSQQGKGDNDYDDDDDDDDADAAVAADGHDDGVNLILREIF